VVPPVGSAGQVTGTTSATPSGTLPQVTMPANARPTPTKSGMLPVVAIGALALVAVLGISRRR